MQSCARAGQRDVAGKKRGSNALSSCDLWINCGQLFPPQKKAQYRQGLETKGAGCSNPLFSVGIGPCSTVSLKQHEQHELRMPIVLASTVRFVWLNRTSQPSSVGKLTKMSCVNNGPLFATEQFS